jgi:hypothetical protein
MKILSSKLLSTDALIHAFTCRLDGISDTPYNSNNIAFHVGDKEDDVIINHKKLAKTLHYTRSKLVHMVQIHSDMVVKVDETHDFYHPPTCDALITDRTDIPLMVMVADCTPILLYDAKHHAIAVIHAGRAGAFNNILNNTINAMHECFSSEGKDIIAVLGPSICQACYEVNATIYNEAQRLGYSDALLQREEKYFLDVNTIVYKQLLECGVLEAHIEVVPHCSACEHETFFSYRCDGGITGRQAGIIMLRP